MCPIEGFKVEEDQRFWLFRDWNLRFDVPDVLKDVEDGEGGCDDENGREEKDAEEDLLWESRWFSLNEVKGEDEGDAEDSDMGKEGWRFEDNFENGVDSLEEVVDCCFDIGV